MKALPPAPAFPLFGRLFLAGLVAVALVFVLAWKLQFLGRDSGQRGVLAAPAASPEEFGRVQPFELVERSGSKLALDALLGRPWIAGFVFTRCTGPCPRISANMRKLQDQMQGLDARLVTFSVDPEFDTPEVLRAYAGALGADRERWLFLTGPLEAVRKVSFESFRLPFERDDAQPAGQLVTHRTVLTVVDRAGAIRGYYEGESDEGVAAALERVRFLAGRP